MASFVPYRKYEGDKEFSAAIDRFAAKVQVSANAVLRKVAFEGFNALIEQSPVDTGAFRSAWRVAIGDVDPYYDPGLQDRLRESGYGKGTDDNGRYTNGGAIPPKEAIESAAEIIPKAIFGDTIYISNRTDYGPEYDAEGNPGLNAGSSPQAPKGWVYEIARDMKSYVENGPFKI